MGLDKAAMGLRLKLGEQFSSRQNPDVEPGRQVGSAQIRVGAEGQLERRGGVSLASERSHAHAVHPRGLAERGGLVRIGVSMYNTREEIDRLLEGVEALGRRQ